MKIAGIIFGVIAVALIVWALWNGTKGWQEENEPMAPNGQKDDIERADKKRKSRL